MRSHRDHALLVMLISVVASTGAGQITNVPGLVVDRTSVIGQQVSVTVRNTAKKTITAWGVRGSVTYETGQEDSIEMYADGFANGFPERDGSAARTFDPGRAVTRFCGIELRSIPVKAVSLRPMAVVFADGSSAGDERIIQGVFDYRARERRVLQTLGSLLDSIDSSTTDQNVHSAIGAAQSQLIVTGDDAEVRDSASYKNVMDNLALADRLYSRDLVRLRQQFRNVVDDVRKRRAAAEQHYQRR
jgi:hypothetical protein